MTTKTISVKVDSGNSAKEVDKLDSEMVSLGKSTNKATSEISKLNKVSKGVKDGLSATAQQASNVSSRLGGLSKNAGQASIQVQQLVGQVQGGVNPMIALSQQAADLGIVLGAPLVGSVVGIAAALGASLIPSLKDSNDEIKDLIEKIEQLEKVSGISLDQSKLIIQQREKEIEAIAKQNEAIAEEIIKLEELQEKRRTAGTGTDTGQFAIPRSAEQNLIRYADTIKNTEERLVFLRAQLTTNNKTLQEANNEIISLTSGNRALSESQRELNSEFLTAITSIKDERNKQLAQELQIQAAVEKSIERESIRTQQLSAEIAIRRQLVAGEIDQQTANQEIALQNLIFSFEARRAAILENEQFTAEQRSALIENLNNQEVFAQEALQLRLTQAAESGARDRERIAQMEARQRKDLLINGLVAAFNITKNQNQKMTKEQKKQAKQSVYINTAAAIARAYGENNFYVASAMALFLAGMQLKQINAIETASGSGGGGAVAAPTPAAQPVPQQQQSNTFEILGIDNLIDELRNSNGAFSGDTVANMFDSFREAGRNGVNTSLGG